MTIEDQQLINQILNGDTNAYGKLIARYTLVLRMLKHREEVEEVSQDAFLKAELL